MALQLYVAVDNAREQLTPLLLSYGEGKLTQPQLPHAFGILFRQLGTCRMLLEGVAAPLFIAQMQAASSYLFRLPALPSEEKVTSLAGCWWDAVAGGYGEAAREIARLSRATPNLDREHEDDFLYVMFLMQRFLAPDTSNIDARAAHTQEQLERLDRWHAVLEGAPDPRLDLCRALQEGDADAFQESLIAVGDQRRGSLERMEAKGSLLEEQALWVKPVWPEGLALLRLAQLDGLGADFDCPDVPALLRVPPPFRYDSNAWRDIDFRPMKR